MIKIHPRFKSESEAYWAAHEARQAAYDAPGAFAAATERETAIQIANLACYRAAEEYFEVSS